MQEEAVEVEEFLAVALLKLKNLSGAVAIYHCARLEESDETTMIIWKDKESLVAYRQGEPVKEAMTFENRLCLKKYTRRLPASYLHLNIQSLI